ncbi:hypothetical protein MCOR27_007251 [Pyricularia oryzae]|uniref:MARVEL domain-containing protein n=2 Tax=Pyricularia TaxID=48558 RepID=A0ABQ8NEZ7_PYRGI|nr:hypothetical protein MCOR01_005280 [Pyricularia oryzae]KAI6295954.1 hypothetical protein MCOR33_007312 [Pyricularia grisea]KAH9427659.1 hypothetical protein MCOR02_011892 [Pyricularia oryzae]KAI6257166.1 hypothetical protein MCOR19_006424 [Pyricularia oryzae]KAI6264213.1 hypothetical protein MCOR26_011498 [Pyricularia oryzae]
MAILGLGLMGSAALTWVAAAIVMGITAYFVHTERTVFGYDGGRHLVYTLVVAVLTVIVYPVVLFLSRGDHGNRGRLMPVNLVFSYLWLAAFVVNTDDWAANNCRVSRPFTGINNDGDNLCGHKHSVMAFSFLAFFFTAINTAAEGFFARRGDAAYVDKRHGNHATTTSTV